MDYSSGNNFPFPEEEAFEYCKETMEQLSNGEYRIVRITEETEERVQNGFMIGSLVCTNSQNQKVILKTILR